MEVVLTESSRDRLSKTDLHAHKGIRISAAYEGGGCGCSVEVRLRLDELMQEDGCTVVEGIPFMIDEASKALLGSDMFTLDYQASVGYVLRSRQETLAYGMKLAE